MGWRIKSTLLVAVAVACALPATASAAMTMPATVLAPVETEFTATSTAPVEMYWDGIKDVLTCEGFSFNGELTRNEEVEGEVFWTEMESAEAGSASGCSASQIPYLVTEPTLTEGFVYSESEFQSGTLGLLYFVHYGPFKCKFSGTNDVSYVPGGSTIHLAGKLNSPFCGGMEFEGDFALTTTEGGGAVILD
jgi:hypothetical protein